MDNTFSKNRSIYRHSNQNSHYKNNLRYIPRIIKSIKATMRDPLYEIQTPAARFLSI